MECGFQRWRNVVHGNVTRASWFFFLHPEAFGLVSEKSVYDVVCLPVFVIRWKEIQWKSRQRIYIYSIDICVYTIHNVPLLQYHIKPSHKKSWVGKIFAVTPVRSQWKLIAGILLANHQRNPATLTRSLHGYSNNALRPETGRGEGSAGWIFTPSGVSAGWNFSEWLKTKIWYLTGVCFTFEYPSRGCTWCEKGGLKGGTSLLTLT